MATASESSPTEAGPLGVGSMVLVEGLVQKPHFNGRYGKICSGCVYGRYTVALPHLKGGPTEKISVKRSNLSLVTSTGFDDDTGRFVGFDKRQKIVPFGTCSGCFNLLGGQYLLRCEACKMVEYCSKKCQRDDWKRSHKRMCKALGESRKDGDLSSVSDRKLRFCLRDSRIVNFMKKQDYAAAEQEIRTSIEEFGLHQDITLQTKLGHSLFLQNRHDAAIEVFREAVELTTRDDGETFFIAFAYATIARILLFHREDKQGALVAVRSGLLVEPQNGSLRYLLRRIHEE